MDPILHIRNFQQIKILADARRLVILQLLMAGPATLSHLGDILGEQPAQVRHHLKLLEQAGLVELVETRLVRGFVEKYYRAKAHAFFLQDIILPADPHNETVLILGSHDLALDLLSDYLQEEHHPPHFLALPVGSLEGLVALRQGLAQIAGCHLLDVESGEYNLPYVRHFFPDRPMSLITLAHREQGLILFPGNPRQIRGVADLARPEVTLVNRNQGSGTRLWLDRELQRAGLSQAHVRGYAIEVRTHTEIAETILQGRADVGLGLYAAAKKFNLDFIPLFQERYDLVFPQEQLVNQHILPFLDYLQSNQFRQLAGSLGGYETSHTGEQIWL